VSLQKKSETRKFDKEKREGENFNVPNWVKYHLGSKKSHCGANAEGLENGGEKTRSLKSIRGDWGFR